MISQAQEIWFIHVELLTVCLFKSFKSSTSAFLIYVIATDADMALNATILILDLRNISCIRLQYFQNSASRLITRTAQEKE